MPFQKGKSGNPSGRPKVVAEVRQLARKHGPDALKRIVKLMNSPDERVGLAACQEIMNRAYGKPRQELTGEDGGPIPLEIRWATSNE